MKFESDFVNLLIRDGILEVSYKQGLHINYEIAEKIVSDRLSFADNKKMAAIIMSRGLISMDKPAREYLASQEGIKNLLATAIIVDTAFSRFLGNFFLRVNKTNMPVKIFSHIPQAKRWLQQFII